MDKKDKLRAIILLGTLKRSETSNTEALCQFFGERLQKKNVDFEIVKLVDHAILQGTYSEMGDGDEWPSILEKILASQIFILATPVWWGNHSSETQRVIERLDEIHDKILAGEQSQLEGKVGGIIITGDGDGAQNIIASVANFYNAVGILLPPFASLSVLSEKHKKGAETSREELYSLYEKDYGKTADTMIEQLLKHASASRQTAAKA